MRVRRATVSTLIGVFMFLAGTFVFLLPGIDALRLQQRYERELAHFPGEESLAQQQEGGESDAAKDRDEAYQFLLAYNERVIAGIAGAVNDPWGLGSDVDALESVGMGDAVVGVLRVGRLNLEVPIFLGASSDHMARGCAVISGTSAPLGQSTSNVVIAGHRGMLFRDIEDIQPGEVLTIETRWDTLTYQAVGSRVISPNDAQAVGIQKGHDLVTLLTCHPYGHNTQRYLAIFERVHQTDVTDGGSFDSLALFSPLRAIAEAFAPCDSIQLRIERWLRVAGFALLMFIPVLRFRMTRLSYRGDRNGKSHDGL
ncbi:MAG: class C sortase [Acidobacteriota bacterium]|nr:class C sortase [Acidobacteriota bacterium]